MALPLAVLSEVRVGASQVSVAWERGQVMTTKAWERGQVMTTKAWEQGQVRVRTRAGSVCHDHTGVPTWGYDHKGVFMTGVYDHKDVAVTRGLGFGLGCGYAHERG